LQRQVLEAFCVWKHFTSQLSFTIFSSHFVDESKRKQKMLKEKMAAAE